MRIAILQTDIVWANPAENIRKAELLMQQAGAADLYVLPEMWATGFAVQPEGIAEDEDHSSALAWMKRMAIAQSCAVCGSLAVRVNDGSYRNRHYFVMPDHTIYYDKRHLFAHGHENDYFTPGQEAVVVEWRGLRLLLQTCYDLRFPCFSRYGRRTSAPSFTVKTGEKNDSQELLYDAIVYVANWPQKRQDAWDTLIRARAIENQCYVIAVNRIGDDPACHYCGGSVIVDHKGRYVANCHAMQTWTANDIEASDITTARSRFRVLDDRDSIYCP